MRVVASRKQSSVEVVGGISRREKRVAPTTRARRRVSAPARRSRTSFACVIAAPRPSLAMFRSVVFVRARDADDATRRIVPTSVVTARRGDARRATRDDAMPRDAIDGVARVLRARLGVKTTRELRMVLGVALAMTTLVAHALAKTSRSTLVNVPVASVVTAVCVVVVSALARGGERRSSRRERRWGAATRGDETREAAATRNIKASVEELLSDYPEVFAAWGEVREKIITEYVVSLWYESMTDDLDVPNAIRIILDGAFAELARRAREMDLVSFALREIPDVLSQSLESYRSAREEVGESEFRKLCAEDAEDVLACVLRKQGELHPAVSGEIETTRALRALSLVMSDALMDGEFASGLTTALVRELIVVSLLRPLLRFAEPRWANRGVLYLTGTNVDYDEEEVKDMLSIESEGTTVVDDSANVSERRSETNASATHSRTASDSIDAALTGLYSDFKLSARITGAEIVGSGSSSYAVYLVTVNTNEDQTWVVPRRFRNFETLHRRLRDVDREATNGLEFPSKSWIRTSLSGVFMETRRKALDTYMKSILASKSLAESSELFTFLDARPGIYDPDRGSIAPELMKTMTEAMEGMATMVSNSTSDLMGGGETVDEDRAPGEAPTLGSKKPPRHTRMSSMYKEPTPTVPSVNSSSIEPTSKTTRSESASETNGDGEDEDAFVAEVESCMNGPVLDLFECVFTLRSKPMMRRALVSLVRQTIEFFFSIERSISKRFRDFRSAGSMARALSWIRRVVWPESPYPPDTPARLAREAETARQALLGVFTNETVQTIMGTRASARAALDVYSLLQSPTCCRHIGFVALEAFIVSLFPEVIAHAASKDLERALEA